MKFNLNGYDLYINHNLIMPLDTLIYNVPKDWDSVLLVTGDRLVRVGKSVLAQIIAAYLAYRLKTPLSLDSIYFDSKLMVKDALKLPKHSVLIYDEGREGLSGAQRNQWQKDLLDYFAQCGALGHIFVIVIDDYFVLPEQVAVGRSEYLFNCYRVDETTKLVDLYGEGKVPVKVWERGQAQFFDRTDKKKLFDMVKLKKIKSYTLTKSSLPPFDFTNQYVVDESAYRTKKRVYLTKLTNIQQEAKLSKTDVFRDKVIMNLVDQDSSSTEIRDYLKKNYDYDITDRSVRRIIAKHKQNEASIDDSEDSDGQEDNYLLNTGKTLEHANADSPGGK